MLAGNGVLRYRPFLDRKQRRAGLAVEGEKKAGLRGLDHRIDGFSVVPEGGQRGLRADVVVPQVVMHQLLTPFELAGFAVERDAGIGPAIVSVPLAADEI